MLNDPDPMFEAALVFPNAFAQQIDVMTILDGICHSKGLLNTKFLRKLNTCLVKNQLPAWVHQKFHIDDY